MCASSVLFVFSILLASGLTGPTKKIKVRHANDKSVSTISDTNTSTVTVKEVSSPTDKEKTHESIIPNIKLIESYGDKLLNKIKERSLVKIIKKSKRPRYKLRDSILEDDLFSVVTQDVNNNSTVTFREIYNPGQPNYIMIKSATNGKNTNSTANILNIQKKHEFINTYLPLKAFTNGSEVEIIKNTILRAKSLPNYKPSKNKTDKNEHLKLEEKKNVKHQVRKYFRLHSSIAKELEESSALNSNKDIGTRAAVPRSEQSSVISWDTDSGDTDTKDNGTAEPTLRIDDNPYGQPLGMQSIVLRWNLILV